MNRNLRRNWRGSPNPTEILMKRAKIALLAAAVAASFAHARRGRRRSLDGPRPRAVPRPGGQVRRDPGAGRAGRRHHGERQVVPGSRHHAISSRTNIAAELVLTYPQKHDVTVQQSVAGRAGGRSARSSTCRRPCRCSTTSRPRATSGPTWAPGSTSPGSRTWTSRSRRWAGSTRDDTSWGAAFGAGFDYKIDKNLFLNFDVKKVYIGSDVYLNGNKVTGVSVDPILYSVGLGWRF